MTNQIDLSGARAVVTGGAQGIGRAVVERFLASGAAVAIWDRDAALAARTASELSARLRTLDGGARADRHPGQQCWRGRSGPDDVGVLAGRVGAGARRQPHRSIL